MRSTIVVIALILFIVSCQIREEINFNADGSGSYELGFDMSEMMGMGGLSDSLPPSKSIDTLINFATFLDQKRDSISKLSKSEQEKLQALRPLQFSMKMSEEAKQMDMRLTYVFKNLDDISKFAEAVKKADIKELDQIMNPRGGMGADPNQTIDPTGQKKEGMEDFFSMAKSFKTTFTPSRFSRTVTKEAIAEMEKKKDTALKADDPFVDMIRFKQIYRFPYKVKSVSNTHARILSDFKGIELEANMFEANNDPEFFNIEVEFDK